MKTPAVIAAFLLLALALPPTAEAGHRPLWQCDDPPDKVIAYLLANAIPILLEIMSEYVYAYAKTKCTAMEFFGVCQDETTPMTPPFPGSTGGRHPHRGLCWEYIIIPGAGTIPCAPEQKIEHRQSFDFHTHTCVWVTKLQ